MFGIQSEVFSVWPRALLQKFFHLFTGLILSTWWLEDVGMHWRTDGSLDGWVDGNGWLFAHLYIVWWYMSSYDGCMDARKQLAGKMGSNYYTSKQTQQLEPEVMKIYRVALITHKVSRFRSSLCTARGMMQASAMYCTVVGDNAKCSSLSIRMHMHMLRWPGCLFVFL